MLQNNNLLGALVTIVIYISASLTFLSRMAGKPQLGLWFGVPLLLMSLPLLYLLIEAPHDHRSGLYFVQVGLMLAYLLAELLLDYVYRVNFRQVRWMVITYVTLFFAATGGMLGVARLAGRTWTISAVILFFVMTLLAFIQRELTGM